VSRFLRKELDQRSFKIGSLNRERDWIQQVVPFAVPACTPCNSGWLADTDKCAPILKQLIMGVPTVIPEAEQCRLALWIAKCCMGLDRHGSRHGRVFSPSDLRWIASRRRLPETCSLWLAEYRGSMHLGAYFPRSTHVREAPDGALEVTMQLDAKYRRAAAEMYNATLFVNHFVGHIWGHTLGSRYTVNFKPSIPDILVRLWPPPGGPILWPPRRFVDDTNISGLVTPPIVNAWGGDSAEGQLRLGKLLATIPAEATHRATAPQTPT
jgi:hypothetical protein